MEKVIVCAICGKEFTTVANNRKYCSIMCREVGRTKNRMLWKDKNPGYYAEYSRERRKAADNESPNGL